MNSRNQEEAVEERRVRWGTLQTDASIIEYNVGDFIEVLHSTTPEDPKGWCLAKIIHKRDEFYFVHYENYDNIYDEIVLLDQIRPVNARGGPTLEEVKREAVRVPQEIVAWCSTEDCEQKLASIISKSKAYNVSYRPVENLIVCVGETKPVDKASILAKFVVDHQCELIHLENENTKISKSIESKRQKIKSEAVEEVFVPKELVGLIIGKGGANITYVKQEYGVGIHIIEHDSENHREFTETEIPEDKALIRIFGKDPKWVKAAKKEIYLEKETIEVDASKIDYVRGYQNSILNDMKEKSKCVKIFVHEAKKGAEIGYIEVIGNEDSIEKFKLLLDTHLSYFGTYQEKETENRELTSAMKKINNNYGEAFYQTDGGYKNQGGQNAKKNRGKKY